jgi:hypothetical protein
MDNRKVSLLLPSAYRARQLWPAVRMALNSTDRPLEICVSIVATDSDSVALSHRLPVVLDVRTYEEYQRGAVYAWNKLLRRASGDVIALWADDLVPQSGWIDHALAELDRIGGHGLIGLNDLSSDGNEYAAHWLADRSFIKNELGGVMYPPAYKSWWCDREVTDRAKALDLYSWAKSATVEHLNYTFGKSQLDRTYREAGLNYEADRLLYEQRKAAGFPPDGYTPHENTTVLPIEPERAETMAQDRRKYPKGSMGKSNRLLADSER